MGGTMSKRAKIYVGLPHRPGGEMAFGLWTALGRMGTGGDFDVHGPRAIPCSMLPLSFNMLWCEALNLRKEGVTHFAMVHSDVAPLDDGWLTKLHRLQVKHEAHVMSSVIALKDERGQSSTGIMNVDTREMRKLTLEECHGIKHKTFDAARAGFPGHCLLMNSGCWIADITGDWAEKMCFRFHDHVFKDSEGNWKAACVGEDWLFSIDCWRLGLRCFATTELAIEHQGVYQYPNMIAWGTKEADTSLAWNIEPPASWNWIDAPTKESSTSKTEVLSL
jgi:hypothetical protein